MNQDTMPVKVKFITILQKYTGNQREVEMELPADPGQAIERIISQFQIPWEGNLEKYVRVFVNREISHEFIRSGKRLHSGDTIAFIPFSGGG